MTRIFAGTEEAGKTCPFCQTPIKPGVGVHVCDSCLMPHHAECWDHNQGCTTFGCDCGPAAHPRVAQASAPQPSVRHGECPICGYLMGPFDSLCPRCENMRRQGIDPTIARRPVAAPQIEQTSYGGYIAADDPVFLSAMNKWNWGAFAIAPIWCAAMNMWGYFALYLFLSFCCGHYLLGLPALIMAVILGVKGNEMAWTARQWRDLEHFKETQRVWNAWGIGIFIVDITLILIGIIAWLATNSS